MNTLKILMFALLSVTALGCGAGEEFFDCNDLCRKVDQCMDIDRSDCRQACRQDSSPEASDACDDCLDNVADDECSTCASACSEVIDLS